MYYPPRPRTGCVQRSILLIAGVAAVLLGLSYLSAHPDFFGSLVGMATSDQPVTVVLWKTPTANTAPSAITPIVHPTSPPPVSTQRTPSPRRTNAQPVEQSRAATPPSESGGIAPSMLLLASLCVLFVVLFGKIVFGSPSRRRRR